MALGHNVHASRIVVKTILRQAASNFCRGALLARQSRFLRGNLCVFLFQPLCHTLLNRLGTWRHLPAFGVAGVALVALGGMLGRRWSLGAPRHFAGQAWYLVTPTFG